MESIDQSLDENELFALRKAKLDALRETGQAFPNDFRRTHLADALQVEFERATKEGLAETKAQAKIAGRIILKRLMGKASFLTVQDGSGRIQLYVTRQGLGEDAYEDFKSVDIGDIVGAEGVLMKTMKGELSLAVSQIRMLTKSLRPLPEKHKGLTDTETRYRQRYLDLMVNEDSRLVFVRRAKIVDQIRRFDLQSHWDRNLAPDDPCGNRRNHGWHDPHRRRFGRALRFERGVSGPQRHHPRRHYRL